MADLAVGVLLAAVLSAGAAPALASSGPQYGSIGQYGEAWRGGGFDAMAYNGGLYNRTLTPGKFVDPVGFAVDTHDSTPGGDGTALYVLDRTSNLPGRLPSGVTVTSWRLQKLDDRGNVLGTSEFSLPANVNNDEMLGLTVDPASGRVYALVVAFDQNASVECVDEILAWSTTPKASQLVAPTGMRADGLSRGVAGFPTPAVLSTSSQLVPGGNSLIQNPQGLALDVTGGVDYLAIQGADGSGNGFGSGIAQVSTASGAITQQWSSSVLSGLANDNSDEFMPPAGISTAADGTLTVLLNDGAGATASDVDVVDVPANLSSTPTILSSLFNTAQPGGNTSFDNAAVFTSGFSPEFGDPDGFTPGTTLAAPQVVGLSNGLYAAEFEPDFVGQTDPENPTGVQGNWTAINPGVRMLQPESDRTLSNPQPPVTSIFDTLGNTTINQTGVADAASACNLSDPLTASTGFSGTAAPSLAAGAGGSLWVLTRGIDSSTGPGPAAEGGRELIQLSPGGTGFPCPVPSGTFTVANQGGAPQPASTSRPLVVTVGATVNFDASAIHYLGAATNAYQWNFGDGNSTTTVSDANTLQWPLPTASEHYTSAGTYTVTLKMFGDFGEYDQSGAITVTSGTPPRAAFTFAPAGQQATVPVSFDGSGSTPSPGAGIIDYHWDWGDGTFDETPAATDSHAYLGPGSYTVRLTVRDSRNGLSAPVSQTVAVVAPPPVPVAPAPPTPNPIPATPIPKKPSRRQPPAVTATIAATASEKGLVRVIVFCHPGPVSCAGTVELKARTAAGASAKKHRHRSVLVLGRARFGVRPGRRELVYIQLSVRARALLRRSHRVPVISTITLKDAAGPTIVTAQHRTLRVAGHKHKKHRR